MNKRGDKIISVYWFVILFIVAGAVVYMAALFYGAPYDVREAETRILTNQIADCLSEGGYLRGGILGNEDFKNNFLQKCNLNFNVEDVYGWKEQEQYYVEVHFYELDQNAVDGFGEKVFDIVEGNINLKTAFLLEKSKEEKSKRDIDTVVIHYTAGELIPSITEFRDNPKKSIHYIVDRDGTIFSKDNVGEIVKNGEKGFVEEDRVAFHAGCPSERNPCKGERPEPEETCCVDVNKNSIGIELVNLGDLCGVTGNVCQNKVEINNVLWERFTEEQINSLVNLVSDIASRYNIPLDRWHIIGHEEVAPEYKHDPGPAFNWIGFMEQLRPEGKLSPFVGRSFYVLDKTDEKPYIIKILAVVRKTEKNEA